jgi:hypothetical protein
VFKVRLEDGRPLPPGAGAGWLVVACAHGGRSLTMQAGRIHRAPYMTA